MSEIDEVRRWFHADEVDDATIARLLDACDRRLDDPAAYDEAQRALDPLDTALHGMDWWERRQAGGAHDLAADATDHKLVLLAIDPTIQPRLVPRLHHPDECTGHWRSPHGEELGLDADGRASRSGEDAELVWFVHRGSFTTLYVGPPGHPRRERWLVRETAHDALVLVGGDGEAERWERAR